MPSISGRSSTPSGWRHPPTEGGAAGMAGPKPSESGAQAAGLLRRAAQALKAGQPEAAEALTRQALALAPGERGALYLNGLALLSLGRPEAALAPLERAAEGTADPAVETNLAMALAQTGKEKEAVQWLERAVARMPAFAPAFLHLGRLVHQKNRVVEAKALLARAVELAPGDADALVALAETFMDLGEAHAARALFERALAARPGWPQARQGSARAIMDEGNYEAALAHLRRLAAEEPQDASVLLDLASCLQELGRLEEALAAYRRAAAADPRAYRQALTCLIGAARGTFWLRPSVAAEKLPRRV